MERSLLYWFRKFLEQDVLTCGFYACLLFVSTAFLYHLGIYLRYMIKINTECWFCMKKTRVCLANRNSWTCSHCLQYNGFSKSGSYNKVIDDHYELNEDRYCQPSSSGENYEQHRLCNECNKNQEMKIKLLADFVPLDENNFTKEATEFRKHLESVYKLCSLCELLVEKVLKTKLEDGTTNIRQQIKELCLTDLGSSSSEDDLWKSSSSSSTSSTIKSGFNPFSTYTTTAAFCLTPNQTPFSGDLFGKSSQSFSYFQYAYSKSAPLYSNDDLPEKSVFGSGEHFSSKGPFMAFAEGASFNEQLSSFPDKSPPQYSPGSPRILNYYVNYRQQSGNKKSSSLKPIEKEAASSKNISIWINNMLHTFELILLLVIIGLIIILLSMPVTFSYNSEFNNFSLNIVLNKSA